ncbi:cell wall-binding repeat-containing protein [Anaerosoma tenue]|uniref:cell wall-binding repeat-containing protein n=1 Tax=Anaerosoma tenue TaxID=2933588 RepID=UPI002260EB88|nr:cell wall-binding repeat-containing protein [Anaerosoma tenue]MCK8114645.1 cell wall-binding repeat-containing protein [Anaerosoma tenue]
MISHSRPILGPRRLRLAALAVTVASLFAPAALAPAAHAAVWSVDTYARTEADLRTRWEALAPTYEGTPYVRVPSIVAPYAPGETTQAFVEDGLGIINYGRYLAGLPSDVVADPTFNLDGQYGAVLLATCTSLTHYPAQPDDMGDEFYERGYQATSKSNIGLGYPDAESFERACLDDSSSSNIPALGHRRWLLNPSMMRTGIGFAGDGYTTRITTYATDRSRADDVSYDFIAWPSPGIFPVEFAEGIRSSGVTPWSITLNPDRYDWTDKNGDGLAYVVTLRRVSDGRTWTFDASDTDIWGEFFTTDFSYYGDARNAFIFRPDPDDLCEFQAGEQYDVRLSGDIYAEGTSAAVDVVFRTSFGALTGPATTFAAPVVPPGDTLAGPISTRYAGDDRYETAAEAAIDSFSDGASTAVIACGGSFADALAAAPLAGAVDGPILLAGTDVLPGATSAALRTLGVKKVYVVGGRSVVSDAVLERLCGSGIVAERIAGRDRYATARAVAEKAVSLGAVTGQAFLVRGDDFADALAVSSIAAKEKVPVLLTPSDALSAETRTFLVNAGTRDVYIAGGTAAVGAAVQATVDALPGVTVVRWAGSDRYSTGVTVVIRSMEVWDIPMADIGLASGAGYADALAGGAVMAHRGGPLLLTAPSALSAPVAGLIAANGETVRQVEYFGGTSALSAAIPATVSALVP